MPVLCENETSLGEVVEASTAYFRAQCPRSLLHEPPELGAFVKITPRGATIPHREDSAHAAALEEDPFADPPAPSALEQADAPDGSLYAVVCLAATGPSEPGRRASAYGLDEELLREQQPQIFELLCTEFVARPVAHVESGRIRIALPPRPPRLHAPTRDCNEQETCAIADAPDFLRALLAFPVESNADEIIVACLRRAFKACHQDFAFLVRAGKTARAAAARRPGTPRRPDSQAGAVKPRISQGYKRRNLSYCKSFSQIVCFFVHLAHFLQ